MARFLASGLSLVFVLLPFNLSHPTTCCNLFYLWTSTTTDLVFVSTGFGLSTFTTDTTGTARFSLAISEWQLLFSQMARFKSKRIVTTLRPLSGRKNGFVSPLHQILARFQRHFHHPLAFHLPVPLPKIFQRLATINFPVTPSRHLILSTLNHNIYCRGKHLEQRQLPSTKYHHRK